MADPASASDPAALRFSKMHGAGNDFVVLDLRGGRSAPTPQLCRALADRHTGVGCDQILTIEDAPDPGVVAAYRIWNSDGSAAGQCGNGARCVAAWLVRDGAASAGDFVLASPVGRHDVQRLDDGRYRIAMGVPAFDPSRIPLVGFDAADRYTLQCDGGTVAFGAVSMGNPHAVIEVEDVDAAPVESLGRWLQAQPAFPDSVNVGFAQVTGEDRIRLRVFERGVGETLACGSGACAAAAVLMRRGRLARRAMVSLPGGDLEIDWPDDAAGITMAGPVAFVFEGEWWA